MEIVKKPVVALLKLGETFGEIRGQDVSDPEAMASHLVCVGRPDALERGTDLALASGSLVSGVQEPVGRKDQVGLLGDHYLLLRIDPHGLHIATFLFESNRIQDNSTSDDIHRAFTEYS